MLTISSQVLVSALASFAIHSSVISLPQANIASLLISSSTIYSVPVIEGNVVLDKNIGIPSSQGTALFVTTRLRGNNLSAVVAASKYSEPTFPFRFVLRAEDFTLEGQEFFQKGVNSELTISCRLDADGDANTRSPEDLVGRASIRGVFKSASKLPETNIVLKGRGFGGKLVTAKSNQK